MITRVRSFDDRSDRASRAVPAGSRDPGGRDQGRQVSEGKPHSNRIGAGREVRDRKIDRTAVDSLATRSGTDLHRAAARVIRQVEVDPAALCSVGGETSTSSCRYVACSCSRLDWVPQTRSAPHLRGDLLVVRRRVVVADLRKALINTRSYVAIRIDIRLGSMITRSDLERRIARTAVTRR